MAARQAEDDYVERMRVTYIEGVEGWVEDCVALTRPWGFDLGEVMVPTSIWFGTADVLASRAHHEHLLAGIRDARRRELPGGHLLSDHDLAAVYRWLADLSTQGPSGVADRA